MPKIRLDFDREESYALLVATECLRRLFCEEDGGVPMIASIRPVFSDRKSTLVNFFFEFCKQDFVVRVYVSGGDLWPKEGHLIPTRIDVGAGKMRYDFRLEGNPASPVVKFKCPTAGAPAQ